MSCLALSELSLSEQAAVQQSFAASIAARYGALLDVLPKDATLSPATVPALPLEVHPLEHAVAGESSHLEQVA